MKPSKICQICLVTISTILSSQLAQAQIPTIVDTTTPVVAVEKPVNTNTAAISKLEVQCQDLKTVVRKDDRTATMMTWETNYFGQDFSNLKRCQVVSERLQKAANRNGGTFQGLELASGTVNFQAVICALQNGSKKCDSTNLLFTLKPDNATKADVVMQQMLTFANEGTGTVNESTRHQQKADLNLGNWERKVFGIKPNGKKGF